MAFGKKHVSTYFFLLSLRYSTTNSFVLSPHPHSYKHHLYRPTSKPNPSLLPSTTTTASSDSRLHLIKKINIQSPPTIAELSAASIANEQSDVLAVERLRWVIKPVKCTSLARRARLKTAANIIRLDCLVRRRDPPKMLCPKGGQAVVEAYLEGRNGMGRKKVCRFGITTSPGPSCDQITETVRDLYNVSPNSRRITAAALVYMYVEPEFRGLGVGELALEVIQAIHAYQGCDFTVLIADDKGSGKLVDWYEKHGFSRAPKLQDVFGSPNREYGTTMIAPTRISSDFFERYQLKWW